MLVWPFGAVLHVAGFRRPAAIQSGAIPPFGIELDPVGRVGHHQERLAFAQQARHVRLFGSVPAQYAVLYARIATEPHVAAT